MWYDIPALSKLAESFARLPGIGRKSAKRLAFHLLSLPKAEAEAFAAGIVEAAQQIRRCTVCQNLSDAEICPICRNVQRDHGLLCVVESPQDMMAIERTGKYNGLYHVLHGVLSPSSGVKPQDLTIQQLIDRVKETHPAEIILATNQTSDGRATKLYLQSLLTPLNVKLSQPSYGIPVGSDIEFTDEITLSLAMEGRWEI